MCNCGSKRAGYPQLSKNVPSKNLRGFVSSKMWSEVSFRYTGKTSLTAVGTITGRYYRFQKQGDILNVDYRDANAMKAITALDKIIPPGK